MATALATYTDAGGRAAYVPDHRHILVDYMAASIHLDPRAGTFDLVAKWGITCTVLLSVKLVIIP